jgi:DNA-binding NarL/FixJ family response regulator
MDKPLRVFLADDHRIVLDGLRSLLENQAGLEVVGTAASGRETVSQVQQLKPDMLIIDVTLPDLNGIDATRQITQAMPEIKVIALSVHDNLRYVSEMMKAGASGYLLKQCAYEEVALCLRIVQSGQFYLSPLMYQSLLQDYLYNLPQEPEGAFVRLSPREREVLQLLAEGWGVRQIAKTLNLSGKTVETHRANILRKTGAGSIADLVRYAIREGISPA